MTATTAAKSRRRSPEITEAHARCRAFGHSWEEIPAARKPEFGVYVWLRCTRCTMERHDIINPFNGDLLSRAYDAPDGYRLSRDEKPNVNTLRILILRFRRRQKKAS